MLGENKNLKDNPSPALPEGEDDQPGKSLSYTKTNKLITALYMVTDIIKEGEPLRKKLRTLGVEIVSDTHLVQQNSIGHNGSILIGKIDEVMSFLEIARAINLISTMNCSILEKEFIELKQSVLQHPQTSQLFNNQTLLSEFFKEELPTKKTLFQVEHYEPIGHISSNQARARIGVQKGSTLMKVLSDKASSLSAAHSHQNDFLILKKKRREDILAVIKANGGNATITDIKNKPQGQLISCGEKTLQRELIGMVKDGVLKRVGEKRWSRYSLPG